MKKILILIVSIAIYLHFYPQPELIQYYEDKKAEFLKELSQSTKVTFKKDLSFMYQDITQGNIGFSGAELENLKSITSSLDNLTAFYKENCQASSVQKLFHPDNIDKVCSKAQSFISTL